MFRQVGFGVDVDERVNDEDNACSQWFDVYKSANI